MFRSIHTTFWTDTKIVDDYTPQDKFFMLYAMTNNYTNIIGCYEISIKQMSIDLGYSKSEIESLIKKFEEIHFLYFCNFLHQKLLYNLLNSLKHLLSYY